ncbi:MAG: glycosyltransferase family 2 protein [Nitrospira sp.]
MKPQSQPFVSVLTPVYNGEQYLAECIESVLAQTYHNWEYCIVNNCSTDRTLEIAQSYASKDTRIRIHNNSKFVSSLQNHNVAFRLMSPAAKYCKLVDADDWLFQECIERMVALAEAHPTVAIVGAHRLRNDFMFWDGTPPYETSIMAGREIGRHAFLDDPYVFGGSTSTLIGADEVRKRPTFYNEANFHCDIEACFDILRSRDFGFVHQVLTFTRVHVAAQSHFCKRFGTDYLGMLEHLTKYGRAYLSDEEFEQCFRQRWREYYAFLGAKIFDHSDKGLWTFHKKELARLGYRFRYGEVAKSAAARWLDLALNPLKATQMIANKFMGDPENAGIGTSEIAK